MTVFDHVAAQMISFTILTAIAGVVVLYLRRRPTLGDYTGVGLVPNQRPAQRPAHAVLSTLPEAPKTFSGVDHEARYQAPEVMTELLEHERDRRWTRAQRLQLRDRLGEASDGQRNADQRLLRAMTAKSLDELQALDMKDLGLPCIRCGRDAEEHPEFPLCTRTTTISGSPLPTS